MKKEDVLKFNLENKRKMIGGYTDNPVTIQEKLRWLNINDIPWSNKYDKPLKSVCADKLLVKEYAKEKIGKDIAIPTLKIYNSINEINFNELPEKFVIKTNHNSGGNIICSDKTKLNIPETKANLKKWIEQDYTFRNGFESHYHWIDRKIFAEQYMDGNMTDYKFYCFNGTPKFIHVIDDRFSGNMHFNFYDLNFNKMSLEQTNHPASKGLISKPKHLDIMIEYAKKLSKDFKFVRVDLYEINNTVYLGELTFLPDVAIFHYKNKSDEKRVGDMLNLGISKLKTVQSEVKNNIEKGLKTVPKVLPTNKKIAIRKTKTFLGGGLRW